MMLSASVCGWQRLAGKFALAAVRLLRSSQTFEGRRFIAADCLDRNHTRSNNLASVQDPHCAMPHPNFWTAQADLVGEDEEERSLRVNVNSVRLTINF